MKTLAAAIVLPLALAGCSLGDDAPPLPPDWLEKTTRTFRVDLARDVGPAALPFGIDGIPAVDGDGLEEADNLQRNGVRLVRYPRGSRCTLTLDAVFPDGAKPTDADASYRLDTVYGVATQVRNKGIAQVWTAMYDVGAGACTPTADLETGGVIGDPDRWFAVITGVLDRMRQKQLLPKYVEFLPDAFGRSGYKTLPPLNLYNLYYRFRRAMDQAFPPDEEGRQPFDVMGPSFPLADPAQLADTAGAWQPFLAHLGDQPQDAPDVVTFLGEADALPEHDAMLAALRDALDRAGLPETGIANVAMRPSAAAWKTVTAALPREADQSAWLGAFLAAARIRGADRQRLLIADRLGGPATAEHPDGTDLFLSADGTRPRPALVAQMPFLLAEHADGSRVAVETVGPIVPVDDATTGDADLDATTGADGGAAAEDPTDLEDVTVMATRTAAGGATLIVAAGAPAIAGQSREYVIEVTGLPGGDASWVVRRAVIDGGSDSLRFNSEATYGAAGGTLRVTGPLVSPAVHYVTIEPKP